MDIRKELDLAIKRAEVGEDTRGYKTEKDGKTREYEAYMTNEAWKSFIDGMCDRAKREYTEADGGELTEKCGRPPKMASYGSSSRMIYALSHGAKDFRFEKKLHTTVGGTANIDGFADKGDKYIFVEAKCRELYLENRYVEVSRAYEELYGYINGSMGGSLVCEMRAHEAKDRYMRVRYLVDGEEIRYFDIKQMICHFLGIATALLTGELSQRQIDFLYLLYDPTELDCAEEIKDRYTEICGEIISPDMNLLFVTVLRYLRDKGVGELDDSEIDQYFYNLTFTLCNQEFYTQLI